MAEKLGNTGNNPDGWMEELYDDTVGNQQTIPAVVSHVPADSPSSPDVTSTPGVQIELTKGGNPLPGGSFQMPAKKQSQSGAGEKPQSVPDGASDSTDQSQDSATISKTELRSARHQSKPIEGPVTTLVDKAGALIGSWQATYHQSKRTAASRAIPDAPISQPQNTGGSTMSIESGPLNAAAIGRQVAVPAPRELTAAEQAELKYVNFEDGIPEKRPVFGELGKGNKTALYDEQQRRIAVLRAEKVAQQTYGELDPSQSADPDRKSDPTRLTYHDPLNYYSDGVLSAVEGLLSLRLPSQTPELVMHRFMELGRAFASSHFLNQQGAVIAHAQEKAGLTKEDRKMAPHYSNLVVNTALDNLAMDSIATGLDTVVVDPLRSRRETEPSALDAAFGAIEIETHHLSLTGEHLANGILLGATVDAIQDKKGMPSETPLIAAIAAKLPEGMKLADVAPGYVTPERAALTLGNVRSRYLFGTARTTEISRTIGGPTVYGSTYEQSFVVEGNEGDRYFAGFTPRYVQAPGGEAKVIAQIEAVQIPPEMAARIITAVIEAPDAPVEETKHLGVGVDQENRGVIKADLRKISAWLTHTPAVGLPTSQHAPHELPLALTEGAVPTSEGYVVQGNVVKDADRQMPDF